MCAPPGLAAALMCALAAALVLFAADDSPHSRPTADTGLSLSFRALRSCLQGNEGQKKKAALAGVCE